MMKKISLNIPQKSISYLMICGGIIALIVLLGLLPLYLKNINSAGEIKKIEYQIEEQKGLGPVYLNMKKALESKNLQTLPNPKKTTISREDVAKFQNDFRTIAGKSGVITVSLTPDLSTMVGSSKVFLHNAVVKGEFVNFRKMIIALTAIPYLDRIEDIRITQHSDSMECRIKIWLALGA
jgi:hypothetical protein